MCQDRRVLILKELEKSGFDFGDDLEKMVNLIDNTSTQTALSIEKVICIMKIGERSEKNKKNDEKTREKYKCFQRNGK